MEGFKFVTFGEAIGHDGPRSHWAKNVGSFILDEIRYPDGRVHKDVAGGAGTYAALGCRLFFQDPCNAERITHIVHEGEGTGVPEPIRQDLRKWLTNCWFMGDRYMNKALNIYDDQGVRHFEFQNDHRMPPNRVGMEDLDAYCANGDVFHMICHPIRAQNLAKAVYDTKAKLQELTGSPFMPMILWEPNEGDCKPEMLDEIRRALQYVTVFSPNLHELGALYDIPINLDIVGDAGYEYIQILCHDLQASLNTTAMIVVRLGKHGCFVQSSKHKFAVVGREVRIVLKPGPWPSYRIPSCYTSAVKDVTGAGNAFMGGFAYGLFQAGDLVNHWPGISVEEIAALHGNVAASFAIEQVGMPTLQYIPGEQDENNDPFSEKRYLDRVREMQNPLYTTLDDQVRPPIPRQLWNGRNPKLRLMAHLMQYYGSKHPEWNWKQQLIDLVNHLFIKPEDKTS